MLRKLILLLLMAASLTGAHAQNTIFLSQGKIEYQRTVNVYAQINNLHEGDHDDWSEVQKKAMNHFRNDFFDLSFNQKKTLYRPGRESDDKPNAWGWNPPAQGNVVYTNLDSANFTSQKNIFDDLFIVKDSVRDIRWKITSETRTIAGFTCRRANAIIMDSIYVVAFYTDEILTTGGPECFNGLPGMILGISMPHEHITWMATKVEAASIPEAQLTAPVKGKKTNSAGLLQTLKPVFNDWGKYGKFYIQAAML